MMPTTFSPDGQLLCAELYWTNNMNVDLALLTPSAPKSRRTLWQTPTSEVTATISPDGRWLTYLFQPFGNIRNLRASVSERG